MKKAILVSAMGAIGFAGVGVAQAEEVGRVISSTPVVQQVPVQRQVCNPQPVAVQQPTSGGGAILGAIVGGLLGHSVGGGFGKAAATGVGVVAGAAVGDSIERRDGTQIASAQACSMQTSYENRTTAYNVQYEYGGKTYNVQMPYDPGPTIRLNVTPVSANEQPLDAAQPPQQYAQTVQTAPVYATQTPSVVYPAYAYPAYPAYSPGYYPYYARPYWYPPVSLSIGYVYSGGRHWHH